MRWIGRLVVATALAGLALSATACGGGGQGGEGDAALCDPVRGLVDWYAINVDGDVSDDDVLFGVPVADVEEAQRVAGIRLDIAKRHVLALEEISSNAPELDDEVAALVSPVLSEWQSEVEQYEKYLSDLSEGMDDQAPFATGTPPQDPLGKFSDAVMDACSLEIPVRNPDSGWT